MAALLRHINCRNYYYYYYYYYYDRSPLDLEAEHMASPWMTCLMQRFGSRIYVDVIHEEKNHTSSTTATDRSHKRREYFVGLFTLHEEGDFECVMGTDGKPEQFFQCSCDVVFFLD